MKPFNIDIEAADAVSYEAGMTRIVARVTVRENSQSDFSELLMSEATTRRLHNMLGNIVRNIDQGKAFTSGSCA